MKTKICIKCNIEKSIEKFHKQKDGKFGVRTICKLCRNKLGPKEILSEGFKRCTGKCREVKYFTEFHKSKTGEYGVRGNCKKCISEEFKLVYKSKIKKEDFPEGFKRCIGDKISCNKIQPLLEFPKKKGMVDGHLNQCKSCRKEYNKQWSLVNKEKRNKYYKNKRKNDINYRIIQNLRGRLYDALKGNPKIETTMKLIGCSIEFLKEYLKSKFYDEMTWINYGKYWEIDHIIPCSLFDLTDPKQQIKCFHYINLQPLTCKENRSKGNKILYEILE